MGNCNVNIKTNTPTRTSNTQQMGAIDSDHDTYTAACMFGHLHWLIPIGFHEHSKGLSGHAYLRAPSYSMRSSLHTEHTQNEYISQGYVSVLSSCCVCLVEQQHRPAVCLPSGSGQFLQFEMQGGLRGCQPSRRRCFYCECTDLVAKQ